MSRLYKKCFIASGGLHVLLALILVICPAWLVSKPKQSDDQPIIVYPDILIDSPFTSGGRPDAGPKPAPAPTPPAPAPAPAPAPPPQPQKPAVKEVAPPKNNDESLEVAKDTKPKRKLPDVSTTAVVVKDRKPTTPDDTSAEDRRVREERERRNRLVKLVGDAAGSIGSGTAPATKIEGSPGTGGGGPSYASYGAWVRSVYERAWVAPDDATVEDAVVEVSVTIARDGAVVDKRIVTRSGDAAVDASVRRALDKVSTVGRPFPEGAKEAERTYIIPFNLKTKRGTG